MRRALVSALAAPALLLAACGGEDETPTVEDPPTSETSEETATEDMTSEEPTTEDMTSEETTTEEMTSEEPTTEETTTEEMTSEETTTEEMTSEEPTTEETTTEGDAGGEPTDEEQAAADRTKEWLIAFATGDEVVCDYMMDFTSSGPMIDSQQDYDLCVSILPTTAESLFTDEMVGVLESVEITGATIEGDTATVSGDNFSEMFAAGLGDDTIVLINVDGEWYVDLEQSTLGE